MLQHMRIFHLLLTSSLPFRLKIYYYTIYISATSWIKADPGILDALDEGIILPGSVHSYG